MRVDAGASLRGIAAAADVVRHYGAEDVLWLLGLEEY